MAKLAVIAALLLLAGGVDHAAAENYIHVTKCDTTSVAGTLFPAIEFEVTNHYPNPDYPIGTILLIPEAPVVPADTCRAIANSSSPEWLSYIEPRNNRVLWDLQQGTPIWPGTTLGGFRLVLTQAHSCCYQAQFFGALFEPFQVEEICFNCNLATAARPATWGMVKAVYR